MQREQREREEEKIQEQEKLEEVMRKRREKVEAWRAQRQKENGEATTEEKEELAVPKKTWTLDDDDDEDEEEEEEKEETAEKQEKEESANDASTGDVAIATTAATAAPTANTAASNSNTTQSDKMDVVSAEVDPLDAYMKDINQEVRKLHTVEVAKVVVDKGGSKQTLKESSAPVTAADGEEDGLKRSTGNVIRSKLGVRFYADDEQEQWKIVEDDDVVEGGYLLKQAKKKVIPSADNASAYEPFRKNFYIEVPAIKKMTKEEVEEYRRTQLEGVRIRGKHCPKPIKEFSQCGLSSKMYAVMKRCGFERPTPIQSQAIPAVMKGRDIIGCAKTGSGKTLAFLLPMLRHILDQRPLEPGEGPIGLVMAPTRELATQIYKDYKKFCKALDLRVVCVYGGSGVQDQISKLKRGAEVVVCTPGRMIDILSTNNGRICNLRRVTFLVLDEADRMFDMGFEPQIMRIVEGIRPDRQTVMFSATFPRPVEMAARKILRKPLEIVVGGRSTVCADVEQHIEIHTEESKFRRLLELLVAWKQKGSVIIFVDTQESVDALFAELTRQGFSALSLHGGHDQSDRDYTIHEFKKESRPILVATSLCARGLDVPSLNLVVNYDAPNHLEDYVHRVGRTGRAGRKGWAYTFITAEEDRYAPDLVKALKSSNAPVPPPLQEMADNFEAKKTAGLAFSHGTGYGGTGYKFNEEEANKKKAEISAQKKAMGLDEATDSEDEEQGSDVSDTEEKEETTAAATTTTAEAETDQPGAVIPAILNLMKQLPPDTTNTILPMLASMPRASQEQALAQIQPVIQAATATPSATVPPAAAAVAANISAAATKAKLLALILNMKKTIAAPKLEAQSGHFDAELEINDYPQQARWKVTHKDALSQITEWTGAAITTRGTYIKPGLPVPPGERKLYLYIEAPSEAAVKKARKEILRILEETAANARPDRPSTGRYRFNF
ncbi:putative ATP-dependent RNA helicase ddx46 [Balamuthia mandrillaris]